MNLQGRVDKLEGRLKPRQEAECSGARERLMNRLVTIARRVEEHHAEKGIDPPPDGSVAGEVAGLLSRGRYEKAERRLKEHVEGLQERNRRNTMTRLGGAYP